MMQKSAIQIMPEFFDRYIQQIPDMSLMEALAVYGDLPGFISREEFERIKHTRYAEGKWTVSDILQHIIDMERILSYRALRFARNDQTILPGVEEESMARFTIANERTIGDLLEEFDTVRKSTIMMFRHFTDEMLQRTGICFNVRISPLALGFVIAGHTFHHLQIIRERYVPYKMD